MVGGKNMFRKMRRFKQELTQEECVQILKEQPRGVLSLIGENEYPYGLPITHWYNPENGHIYFHGAKEGHKIDALKKCNKASFCVMDQGYKKDNEWALNINSVIVFGKIQFVEDPSLITQICSEMCRKFTDDEAYIEHELKHSGPSVLCLELIPEYISGKLVNES